MLLCFHHGEGCHVDQATCRQPSLCITSSTSVSVGGPPSAYRSAYNAQSGCTVGSKAPSVVLCSVSQRDSSSTSSNGGAARRPVRFSRVSTLSVRYRLKIASSRSISCRAAVISASALEQRDRLRDRAPVPGEDAVAEDRHEWHESTLEQFQRLFGAVTTTDAVLEELRAHV